jgi:hypothetical protein
LFLVLGMIALRSRVQVFRFRCGNLYLYLYPYLKTCT